MFNEIASLYNKSLFDRLPEEKTQDISRGTEKMLQKLTSSQGIPRSFLLDLGENVFTYLARKRLGVFIVKYLPSFRLSPHFLEWEEIVMQHKFCCVIAARGHGKSRFFSFAYILWQLWRNTPDSKEGILVTNEQHLGTHLLSLVKEEIKSNPAFHHLIPQRTREIPWTKREIQVSNGSKVFVRSARTAIRGFHPDYFVIDDYLSDRVLKSSLEREEMNKLFSGVITHAAKPSTQIVVVGTPFTKNDLYSILKEHPSCKVKEYPGVFPDGSILWPEEFSAEHLEMREAADPLSFAREIRVTPTSSKSQIFPREVVIPCLDEHLDFAPERRLMGEEVEMVVTGCDFAFSSNVGADYTVYTTIGVTVGGNYKVLEIYREKGIPYNVQINVLKEINSRYIPDIIMCEDNGGQASICQLAEAEGLPVRRHTTTASNKHSYEAGVPALYNILNDGKLILPYKEGPARKLVSELFNELTSLTYENGKLICVEGHDDMVMSLWIALRGCRHSGALNFTTVK